MSLVRYKTCDMIAEYMEELHAGLDYLPMFQEQKVRIIGSKLEFKLCDSPTSSSQYNKNSDTRTSGGSQIKKMCINGTDLPNYLHLLHELTLVSSSNDVLLFFETLLNRFNILG